MYGLSTGLGARTDFVEWVLDTVGRVRLRSKLWFG